MIAMSNINYLEECGMNRLATTASTGICDEILDDLSSRFILNIPQDERSGGLIRIAWQVEIAHWFYLDHYCAQDAKLKRYKLKDFFTYIFRHIPYLKQYEYEIDEIYNHWREYKLRVPTFGAVLLDELMESILLVQSFHSQSWGFPKGKKNQMEDPAVCACREVLEETGIDISDLIVPEDYIESTIHDQLTRLYFVVGIKKDQTFQPKTKGEIRSVQWFNIEQIPIGKKELAQKSKAHGPRLFYMVIPFMKRITNKIKERKSMTAKNKNQRSYERSLNSCNTSIYESETLDVTQVEQSPCTKNETERNEQNSSLQDSIKSKSSTKIIFPNASSTPLESRTGKRRRKTKSKNKKATLIAEIPEQYRVPEWMDFHFDMEPLLKCLKG